MRLIANVFLIVLLQGFNSYAQKDKMYKGLEEALAAHPDSVYRLDLSKNKYTELPTEIYRFKNLQELNLSKNRLTSLPDEFKFDDLRILDLSRNKFVKFPPQICKITSIRNLFMGKNQMEHLSDCIGDMQNLIVFDIWFNPIIDLPKSMTKLRNLRSLDMSGISFTKNEQKAFQEMLPWVKIEFEAACKCNN